MSKFKVGDRVKDITDGMGGGTGIVRRTFKDRVNVFWDDGSYNNDSFWPDSDFKLIEVTNNTPIRTVTRKEIVAGTYGIVHIFEDTTLYIPIVETPHSASELREAAHVLNQIAEALEENG